MCLKKWDLGYQELLDLAQLPTLENRRIYLKLCTLFKITHGLFPFASDVFTPHPNRRHYNDLPLLCQPFARTNSFQSSFVPSTIAIWNHLPHDALTAHSSYTLQKMTCYFDNRICYQNCNCEMVLRDDAVLVPCDSHLWAMWAMQILWSTA